MPNTYTLIASSAVGSGGAASITFSSIPATYTDLVIKASLRSNETTGGNPWDAAVLRFNGSATSYADKALGGDGATVFSFANAFANYIFIGDITNALVTANVFSSLEITIPNYTSANYKSISIDSVEENNATTAQLDLTAGLWSNTSAITSVALSLSVGNFVQYSNAYLYGIKNS
jgi:hypothetical protein